MTFFCESLRCCARRDTTRRYSPTAIDMHFVLDMFLRTRYVACKASTRKVGEYHIETDRKGGYIELMLASASEIYRAERSAAYR